MSNPYRDRLLGVGVITGGLPSKPKVKEGRGKHGRYKATTDELGNTVTQHAKGDRQDVHVRPQSVEIKMMGA
jgi:hypothetical protein